MVASSSNSRIDSGGPLPNSVWSLAGVDIMKRGGSPIA